MKNRYDDDDYDDDGSYSSPSDQQILYDEFGNELTGKRRKKKLKELERTRREAERSSQDDYQPSSEEEKEDDWQDYYGQAEYNNESSDDGAKNNNSQGNQTNKQDKIDNPSEEKHAEVTSSVFVATTVEPAPPQSSPIKFTPVVKPKQTVDTTDSRIEEVVAIEQVSTEQAGDDQAASELTPKGPGPVQRLMTSLQSRMTGWTTSNMGKNIAFPIVWLRQQLISMNEEKLAQTVQAEIESIGQAQELVPDPLPVRTDNEEPRNWNRIIKNTAITATAASLLLTSWYGYSVFNEEKQKEVARLEETDETTPLMDETTPLEAITLDLNQEEKLPDLQQPEPQPTESQKSESQKPEPRQLVVAKPEVIKPKPEVTKSEVTKPTIAVSSSTSLPIDVPKEVDLDSIADSSSKVLVVVQEKVADELNTLKDTVQTTTLVSDEPAPLADEPVPSAEESVLSMDEPAPPAAVGATFSFPTPIPTPDTDTDTSFQPLTLSAAVASPPATEVRNRISEEPLPSTSPQRITLAASPTTNGTSNINGLQATATVPGNSTFGLPVMSLSASLTPSAEGTPTLTLNATPNSTVPNSILPNSVPASNSTFLTSPLPPNITPDSSTPPTFSLSSAVPSAVPSEGVIAAPQNAPMTLALAPMTLAPTAMAPPSLAPMTLAPMTLTTPLTQSIPSQPLTLSASSANPITSYDNQGSPVPSAVVVAGTVASTATGTLAFPLPDTGSHLSVTTSNVPTAYSLGPMSRYSLPGENFTLQPVTSPGIGTTNTNSSMNMPNPILSPAGVSTSATGVIVPPTPLPQALSEQTSLVAGQREYLTKEGDNLLTIAESELGNPTRWGEIRRLNLQLVDALVAAGSHYFPVGTRLVLPVN